MFSQHTLKRKLCFLFTILLCFLFDCLRAQQTDGGISGTITDSNHVVLSDVLISAVHEPSGTVYTVFSSKNGSFLLSGMRIGGPYTVTATVSGEKKWKEENITVRLGDLLPLNIQISAIGKLLDVTVKSTNKQSTVNRYGTAQNITRAQIANIPMISRSLQDVTKMIPQSTKDNSFGGNNFRYNNITVDGAINNDAIGFSPSAGGITGTSGTPGSSARSNAISLDAIEDIQVYLAPYDVKIGNFTGGSINAVTRSGTNKVNGSVYLFGRNATITGKDRIGDIGKMNSDFYDSQLGARVGFPILKNKMFFFTNEEITRRRDPVLLLAGQKETAQILSLKDANDIRSETLKRYGRIFDPGTAGSYNTYSRSEKFFNRIDLNIDSHNQLSIRNNTTLARSINMDRDQMDFRFSSMAYKQTNNQTSTVAELKTHLQNNLSNSLLIGYSIINDKRDPLSDPSLPQVQIQGRTPGTTIYLGTDREASIFKMNQKTWEITDNLTWHSGKNTFLLGTHNELYSINYGFVNAWNGRVDYLSIEDYLNNNPYRVRGSYNFANNTRGYILGHPEAKFNVNMLGLYIQDEIRMSEKFRFTLGIRADYSFIPQKQAIGDRTKNAFTDDFFGNTYYYTPLNKIANNYLNKIQLSPRIGFRYDIDDAKQFTLRGGLGLFTGRIPFAWLGYAFYNTGINYGSFDQRADQKPFLPGTDPIKPSVNGISEFVATNGAVVNNPNVGKTQVDVIDNNFVMPKVLRTSLTLDYATLNGYKFSVEGLYTKTLKDVYFQQINVKDDPRYYGFDRNKKQPVYNAIIDPSFSNVYELSNTNLGYRYSITGKASKIYDWGLNVSIAYTYSRSKDVFNGIRNSMESNWQLNQSLNPNNPALAWSNFDIRHRLIFNTGYRKVWNSNWVTNISIFLSAQSGSPYTYGIVNYSTQGLSQQVSLAYVPLKEEAIRFFKDYYNSGQLISANEQANSFNNFIDNNKYLKSRRGNFTERNANRTPWNVTADLHFAQELHFAKGSDNYFTFTFDIINFTSLISKNWGKVFFSPNTFNSTASIGLNPTLFPPQQNIDSYPVFRFANPDKPYALDYFNSMAQGQIGIRYTF